MTFEIRAEQRNALGRQPRPPNLVTVLVAFAAGVVVALLVTGIGRLFSESLALAFLLGELGLAAGVVLYLAASGRAIGPALRLGRVSRMAYPTALKLGFALVVANFAATVILGPPVRDIQFLAEARTAAERITLAVAVALAAPVIEEALFRGLLQGTLETRLRHWVAIAAAGLPFALLHGPEPALFFFFWSLPVGWVTWRSGSIRPAIVVHAVNNMVGVVGLFATGPIPPEAVERGPGELGVAVLLLAATALWAVRLCVRLGELAGAQSTTRLATERSERSRGARNNSD
jgi:membrane protease YdiL (CAAX protease family)